ncbi:MAG: hypothetical protein DI586_05585 [Micavibrio aeruginosavorus]|uniref:Uncharacterized protein n=1 Tax=Micavibrio aeruginosavorus TaxID=349221 RepID=A0A2W5FIL2_9BACT|nr:MAG: hypothetical protein DI586_05585 [Micavibrio aeruginosavorus]
MTARFILMLFVLPALALSGCAAQPAPAKSVPAGEEAYILGSGDSLRIIVYGQEELSGEFKIDPSGQISIPLIRSVKAAGLTVRQLEDVITSELEPDYVVDPKVSIEVLEYRSVYILGEVRTPGKYPYVPNMTVLQAVAVAGGHTYRANEATADITRIENDMLKTMTVRTNDMVLPGDTVIIKRRWF